MHQDRKYKFQDSRNSQNVELGIINLVRLQNFP